jgi:hypothetical protein
MRQLRNAVSILALFSSVIAAQDANRPNTRDGVWFGFGLGAGTTGADCSNCGTERTGGPSGYVRMGTTITPSVLLGGELTGWGHSSGGTDETMGFASAVLLWYPSNVGAFFVKFGVGGMKYTANDGSNELTATAPAGSLGFGYDIRISGDVSVTPYVNALSSNRSTYRYNGSSSGFNADINLNLVQIGVGLSWH